MSREKIPAETPRKPPAEAAKPSGSFLAKPSFQRRRGRAARVGKAKPKSRGNHRKASARTNTPRELPVGAECAGTAGPRRPRSGRPGRGRDTGWSGAGSIRRGRTAPQKLPGGTAREEAPAEHPQEPAGRNRRATPSRRNHPEPPGKKHPPGTPRRPPAGAAKPNESFLAKPSFQRRREWKFLLRLFSKSRKAGRSTRRNPAGTTRRSGEAE